MWQAVFDKHMAADWPNMSWSNFLDHFEFKMQNCFGSIFCKKLLRTKIGIAIFGPWAHGHCPKYFYKIFLFFFVILGLSSIVRPISCQMAEIAPKNHCFLAPGPGPTGPWPRHTFFPNWRLKKFQPNWMQGGRVIFCPVLFSSHHYPSVGGLTLSGLSISFLARYIHRSYSTVG